MATGNFIAKAEITIDASAQAVWDGLTNPKIIKQYMMGADVISDWTEGAEIKWKGEFNGKSYEDHGRIIHFRPYRFMQYTHISGTQETPENAHTVTVELIEKDMQKTEITLVQDNNASEQANAESEKNWNMMLASLKKILEGQ